MTKAIYIPIFGDCSNAQELIDSVTDMIPATTPVYVTMDKYKYAEFATAARCKWMLSQRNVNYIIFAGGYANTMNQIIEHAWRNCYNHILKVNENSRVPANIMKIFNTFDTHPEIASLGSYVSFYGIGGIKPNTGVYYTQSMGCTTIALDVKKVLSAGNYDPTIDEDDVMKIALMKRGYYIAIDSDVIVKTVNPKCDRYAKSVDPEAVKEWVTMLKRKCGDFFFIRKGKCVTHWSKMNKHGLFPRIDVSKMASKGGEPIKD